MGFAATLVYLAMLILRPQELRPQWAQYPIMDVLSGIVVLSTLLSLVIERRPRPVWQQVAAATLFLLWSAASVAIAVRWLGGAAETLLELLVQVYIFFVLAMNVSSRRRLAACATLICACLLVVLAQSASAYYSGVDRSPYFIMDVKRGNFDDFVETGELPDAPDSEEGLTQVTRVKRARALGFLSDPNDFAQALVATVPLVFLAWRSRMWVWNVPVVLVPASLLVWGVLLTRSRGGLLALLMLLPLAVVIRLKPRARRIAATTAAVGGVPAFVLLFRYAVADASAMGRIEAWSAGLQMLRGSPIWGVGSGFFVDHHERVAHNSLVQCFAETGLVGYFLWLSLVVLSFELMATLADTSADEGWVRWARGVQLSLLGFLVGAMFLSRTTSPLLFLITGLSAAVASSARLDGQALDARPRWAARVLGLAFASIVAVWLTARAAW